MTQGFIVERRTRRFGDEPLIELFVVGADSSDKAVRSLKGLTASPDVELRVVRKLSEGEFATVRLEMGEIRRWP